MPLTRYQIRNEYGLADPELYQAADRDDPEALLEGVAMAGLVGVLRQLGDLAEFAAEIFHDLHEEVMATAARGHGLMVRVQQLEAEFPSIEKAFLSQTSHSLFFSNAGVEWHPNLHTDQNLITRVDLPRFVMDSYEECRGPPRLFLLDKFDVAGAGACLKRYTDPSFFKVEASSRVATVDVQREKKIRKVKKKGSRWRNGETPEVVPTSHAKLHQLFLVERIENGYNDPARLVKLKKRQLNGSPFDSKTGKSYMEKFLQPQSPGHKVVCETSYSPPRLKLRSDSTSESSEILEINTVSPMKMSSRRKETTCPSPDVENIVLKQSVDELNEESYENVSPDSETDIIPSTLHEISHERELAVNEESKSEGSVDGYHSDDVTSEIDNYVDALTTMESEMETDTEYRPKNDTGFLNSKKHVTDSNANEEQLDGQAQFSDFQSFGNSCASDDGNSLFKKERSSFAYSDTGSNLAENTPSDGDGAAKVFPSTETCVADIVDMPSDQLSVNEEILRTKSNELVPNGIRMDETEVPGLGEVSFSSCLTITNPVLPPSYPSVSSTVVSLVGQELDEKSSDCIKPGANGMYQGDNLWSQSVASNVYSQTRDDFLDPVSAESKPVDELDGGDPNVSSAALLHFSNVSELAFENNGSENFVDEMLQMEHAADGYAENLVDGRIGSPYSIISPAEDQLLSSALPEVETCSGITLLPESSPASTGCYPDVVKPECIVTEVDDSIPVDEMKTKGLALLTDAPQIHSYPEQQSSDMTDDVSALELDSAELGVLNSVKEMNRVGISATADGEEIDKTTSNVDVTGGDAISPELLSDHPNCSAREDRDNLDDIETEPSQAEDLTLDEMLQMEHAADGYAENLVDGRIGSPYLIISPVEEQLLSPALPEVETCSGITLLPESSPASTACHPDVVKPECIVTEVDDSVPADEMRTKGLTLLTDAPQIHSYPEQQLSDMTDDVAPLGLDSAELGVLNSVEEMNRVGISATADGEEIDKTTSNVDVAGEDAISPELPSDHPNCPAREDHDNLDDIETEPSQPEDQTMDAAAAEVDDDVKDVLCSSPDLNGSPSRSLLNLQESLSGFWDPHQEGLEFDMANSPDYLIQSEAQKEVNQLTVPTDMDSVPCKSFSCDLSNSEMLDDVHDFSLAEQTQGSLCLSNVTIASTSLELSNQELESRSPDQSYMLENSEDALSLPTHYLPEPETPLEQALELQSDQVDVECLQEVEASSNSSNLLSEEKQSLNHIDHEICLDASSESSPEEPPSQPSLSEFSPQSAGLKFDSTEKAMVSSDIFLLSFGLLSEANPVNLEEMPPLPPLPPMQWRIGKVQHAPLASRRELVEHRLDSFPVIHPSTAEEKVFYGFPSTKRGIMPPQNPFMPLTAVENEKSQDISEQLVRNLVPPSSFSSEMPGMVYDANSLHNSLTLEGTQSLNPFLTLPEMSNERPEHGFHALEGEVVQSSLIPFSPVPPVEYPTFGQNPVSSHGNLIQTLNHLAPETGLEAKTLQHTSQNIEGERGNPPDMSVPPPTTEDEQPQHRLRTSEEETSRSLNTSALLPFFEVGKPNGNPAKLPRPRSPLIEAVAAHDRSMLRKVTERVRPRIGQKLDERDSLLEQIRTKSFNLKPAVVKRPSIQGPKTNLKVAAILEKANSIRQALAGSDEEDDADSWSDT